jgi:hypothetical protein
VPSLIFLPNADKLRQKTKKICFQPEKQNAIVVEFIQKRNDVLPSEKSGNKFEERQAHLSEMIRTYMSLCLVEIILKISICQQGHRIQKNQAFPDSAGLLLTEE